MTFPRPSFLTVVAQHPLGNDAAAAGDGMSDAPILAPTFTCCKRQSPSGSSFYDQNNQRLKVPILQPAQTQKS